jgi:hypothetical protein
MLRIASTLPRRAATLAMARPAGSLAGSLARPAALGGLAAAGGALRLLVEHYVAAMTGTDL